MRMEEGVLRRVVRSGYSLLRVWYSTGVHEGVELLVGALGVGHMVRLAAATCSAAPS